MLRLIESATRLAVVLVFGLSICAQRAGAQSATSRPASTDTSWRGPFFFIHMTDPQFGYTTENKDFAKETELYEKAIAAANKLKPALVVMTGDLIHKPGDPAQIAELKRISARLDPSIPLWMIPGNHDLENIPTPATLETYRKELGRDYYSFDSRGCHFICLDTNVIQQPQDSGDEAARQLAWLKEDLQAVTTAKPKQVMVFMHHPMFVNNIDEADGYNPMPKAMRKPMLDQFLAAGVRKIFAGHLHRNALLNYGDIEIILSGPVGKPLGRDPSGFRIVKVYEDRIEHEYVPLDKVPEKVTLGTTALP